MSANDCAQCGRALPDTAIMCNACRTKLDQALGDIAALWHDLELAIARQTRMGGDSEGRRSAEKPLPYDPAASEVAWIVTNTIGAWVTHVVEHRPANPPTKPPGASLTGHQAGWLLGATQWLSYRPEASEAFSELHDAHRALIKAIDRPADLLFSGPCPNDGGDLYCKPDAPTVTCTTCATEYGVNERRTWLLAAADDHLAHASLIAKAVTNLGQPVTRQTISRWVMRGRLLAHGLDRDGREMYRVGDVLDLLNADTARTKHRRQQA